MARTGNDVNDPISDRDWFVGPRIGCAPAWPAKPVDGDTDLYTAAIASVEDYTIVTTTERAGEYDGMECEVTDLATWVDGMDMSTNKNG